MRFSLKWLLAAMAYVALAAAAFTHNLQVYSQLLTLLSAGAIAYAVLLAYFSRGEQHARAIGFAVGFVVGLGFIFFAPTTRSPDRRLVEFVQWMPGSQEDPAPSGLLGTFQQTSKQPVPFGNRLAAAGAIVCMLAGLAGSMLGPLAYRSAKSDA